MNSLRAHDVRCQSILVNGLAFALVLPYVWFEHSHSLPPLPGALRAPIDRFVPEMATYALGLVGHALLLVCYCLSTRTVPQRGFFLCSQIFTMSTTVFFFCLRAPTSLFLMCWVLGVLGMWANAVQFRDPIYRASVLVWLGVSFAISTVFAWRTGQYFNLLANPVICIATVPVTKLLLAKQRDFELRIANFEQEVSAIAFANSIVSHDIRNDLLLIRAGSLQPGMAHGAGPALERPLRRIVETLELLSFNQPTRFKAYPALATLASQKLGDRYELDPNLTDWIVEFNFYFFCRVVDNLLQNAIEAHARRRLTTPIFVRIYADEDRLCVHDNCGGFSHEAIGRVSDKGPKPEHFTRVLIDNAERMNYAVEFDTVDGGGRVSLKLPRAAA
jgi:hypothetical protein